MSCKINMEDKAYMNEAFDTEVSQERMRAKQSSPPATRPQGYGLSETCAASFLGQLDDWNGVGTVGLPTSCNEFKLRSVPEMGYSALGNPP